MLGYFECCTVISNYICCEGTQKIERMGSSEPAVSVPSAVEKGADTSATWFPSSAGGQLKQNS